MFENLHAVLLLELQILLVQGVDSVNHGLDQLNLRVSQPVLVGDVVGVASLAARLSTCSTGLQVQHLAPSLEGIDGLLGPAGQVNVHGSAHASSQVGGARVDVAELLGQDEVLAGLSLDRVADSLDSPGEPLEDSLDVTALLHGDDPKLILLVDPDQEGLVLVVEDSTALGPVTLHTGNGQVAVTRDKEEVVIDQLLADLLVHASQGVVVSSKVTLELELSVLEALLNTQALLLGDSGGKAESLDGATDADADGVDGHLGVDVALQLLGVHVRGVLEVGGESVVLHDEGFEDISEVDVRVLVSSVDTAVLVVEVDGASDGLGEGEAGGLGDNTAQLVPLLLGHVLGDQRVLGLDVGEFSHF